MAKTASKVAKKPKKLKRRVKKKVSKKPKVSAASKQEIKARQRASQKARKDFIAAALPSIGLGIIVGGAAFAALGSPKLAVPIMAVFPVLWLSYKYPWQALWAFFLYMPISGSVTYAIGGGNALFQLAKDGLYLPALMAIVNWAKKTRQPLMVAKSLQPTVLILLACCILTFLAANVPQQFQKLPGDRSAIGLGILGFKVFMGYIPLIACVYYLLKTKKELLFLTRSNTVMAIICFLLGFMQYYWLLSGRCKGTDHLVGADLFKATLEARCLFGGSLVWSPSQNMIRLPGTFVAPWQWGWYVISSAVLTYTTAFNDPSALWRLVGLVGMGLTFLNATICGQRIALALVPMLIVILLVLTGQVTNLKRFLPIAIGLGVALTAAWVVFPEVIQERIDSFVNRWTASPANEFIEDQIGFTIKNAMQNIFGAGLGRATNSARIFGEAKLIETWFPKVLWEVGFPGLLAFLAFVSAISWTTFRAYRSVKEKNLRGIGASYWVFILFISYQTYYYPLDVDPVAIYYWMMIGVVLRLPVIDKQESDKVKAAEEEELREYERLKALRAKRMGLEPTAELGAEAP